MNFPLVRNPFHKGFQLIKYLIVTIATVPLVHQHLCHLQAFSAFQFLDVIKILDDFPFCVMYFTPNVSLGFCKANTYRLFDLDSLYLSADLNTDCSLIALTKSCLFSSSILYLLSSIEQAVQEIDKLHPG